MYDDSYPNEHPFPRLFILNTIEAWEQVRDGDVLSHTRPSYHGDHNHGWVLTQVDASTRRFHEHRQPAYGGGHYKGHMTCVDSIHTNGTYSIFDCHWDGNQYVAGRLSAAVAVDVPAY